MFSKQRQNGVNNNNNNNNNTWLVLKMKPETGILPVQVVRGIFINQQAAGWFADRRRR